MHDGRHAAVIGLVHARIDAERPLIQAPIFPHADIVVDLAVTPLDRDTARQLQHVPKLIDPGTDADHDIVAGYLAVAGDDCGDRRRIAAEFEALDFDAGHDAHAFSFGLRGKAVDRGGV